MDEALQCPMCAGTGTPTMTCYPMEMEAEVARLTARIAELGAALRKLTMQITEQRDIVAKRPRKPCDETNAYADGLSDGREDTYNDVLEMIDALQPNAGGEG